MKGRIAPPAVSLFIALLISPAVPQEGLFSLWVLWGVPLLSAALVYLVLTGIIFGPPRVVRIFSGAGSKKNGDGGKAEAGKPERVGDEIAVGPDAALADAVRRGGCW